MKALPVLIAVSIVTLVGVAQAQVEIKRDILENCQGALEKIENLPPHDRCELVPYLELVLKRTPEQAAAVSGVAPSGIAPPAGSAQPFAAGEFLRSLDPQADEEARRCALKALLKFNECSVSALPEIVGLAQRPGISGSLARECADGALEISRRAATGAAGSFSSQIAAELVDILRADAAGSVRAVLAALGSAAVPAIVEGFRMPGDKERENVARLILAMEGQKDEFGPGLLGMLESPDEGLQARTARLLADFPSLYPQTVSALVRVVFTLPTEKRAAFLASLKRIFERSEEMKIPLDAEARRRILDIVRGENAAERAVACLGLPQVAAGSPELASELVLLLKDGNEELRICAIGALGRSSLSDSQFSLFLSLLYDKSPRVQLATLNALGFQSERKDRISGACLKLLKGRHSQKDQPSLYVLVSSIARTLLRLDVETASFAPYYVQYLKIPAAADESSLPENELPVVRVSSRAGKPAVSYLLKALRSEDAVVRRRALAALGEMQIGEESTISAMVELLVDKELSVKDEARRVLFKLGRAAVSSLTKVLGRKAGELKLAAALLLLDLQAVEDPRFAAALLSGIEKASCQQKAAAAIKLPESQRELKLRLMAQLEPCLSVDGELQKETREALEKGATKNH